MGEKPEIENDSVVNVPNSVIPDGLKLVNGTMTKAHDMDRPDDDPIKISSTDRSPSVLASASPKTASLSPSVFHDDIPRLPIESSPIPPMKVNVVKLDQEAAFWDIYDALWIEMSYLVTKRIQLLEAFRDGRMFIAKYDVTADGVEHPKFKLGATRPGSNILKSFLVITEDKVLDCLWVVSNLRRCNIGRQLIQGCQIEKCSLAPLTTRDFLVKCGVEAEQYFAINDERLFKDLLRMAIGFNDKIVRKLEDKLYKDPNTNSDETMESSSDKKRRTDAKVTMNDEENLMGEATPPKKKLKISPASETVSSLPGSSNIVSL